MTIFLTIILLLISIFSAFSSVSAFFNSPSAMSDIYSALMGVVFTVSLSTVAIVNQLQKIETSNKCSRRK